MPANTALGIPYPLSTDPPAGHTQMQNLANTVDSLLQQGFAGTPYAQQAGQVSIPLAAANQGTAAVTFIAGRFSQPPRVLLSYITAIGPASGIPYLRLSGPNSAGGMTIVANTSAAVTATLVVDWLATQMLSSNGSG